MATKRARSAIYGQRSFRQTPPELQSKYFETQPDGTWRPIDLIRAAIRYDEANLAEPTDVAAHAHVDVIFCRNVFIYFSDDAIRSTVRGFADALLPDGYLFLGASESLTRLGVDFELAEVGHSFLYVPLGRRAIVENARQPVAGRGALGADRGIR